MEAVLDQNTSSDHYGKITGFTVLNGGSGYDQNISLNVMPIVRLVGYGRPAEISFSREPMFRGFVQDGWDYYFSLKKDVSGNELAGYGYAITPRWEQLYSQTGWTSFVDRIDGEGNIPYERLRLIDSNFTTGGVAPMNRDGTSEVQIFTGLSNVIVASRLLGGFTQSPCFYQYEVTQTNEPLDRVQFYVDGRLIDEKQTPPFSFTFIADDPGNTKFMLQQSTTREILPHHNPIRSKLKDILVQVFQLDYHWNPITLLLLKPRPF